MEYYQQGDVLIKKTEAVKAKAVQGSLLHKGQNHNHTLKGGEFKILSDGDKKYLKVDKATTLTHIEHRHFKIPKGFYAVEIVKEYDHFLEESRNVID